jgi:TP901 family phage tail tape measure protein
MANAYTQDIVLDADGKPVLDALSLVQKFMGDIQKVVTGIGVTSVEDAKKWQQQLALNLKMLKQAQSDLKTLQSDREARQKGFASAEADAKRIAKIEAQADKEANRQKVIEAKVTYGEKARIAREEANIEKQLAKEIAEFEKSQDRAAIASAKEVAAARREAATAAVTAKARGITNVDDARAAKAASDQRLNLLRRERETVASNDAAAARSIADRISVEKALGTAIDGTIRKLNQQAEADRRAQDAATRRLQGQLPAAAKLLAPANVRDAVNQSGDVKSTLVGYQFEQELARQRLQTAIADRNATLEQVTAARQRLELANANVSAAQRLLQEDQKIADVERRLATTERVEQQKAQLALAGQYAREQIVALGPKEAIRRAVEATALAEQKLAMASVEHVAAARQELELARAQQSATEKQTRNTNPLSSILSPEYGLAAFARTSVYGLAAGAAYSAFNVVEGSVSQVVQLEDEMMKLQAIANATDPQLQQIKSSIFEIGATSRYSVIDLAKISQTLAQAGVTAGEMRSVLQSVTTLATASGSTPDEAVNLVTSALGSFQLQASEAARVADLMTSALNRTKLTVQQTGQAIQYVGATAFEQNISLETLLATVGAVAQAGVKSGSTIGTGFRQFLVDLQSPSEKLTEQLKLLGLTTDKVDVAVLGLPQVLENLKNAGFGAGQAYAGLETRAAAFYLVAKNNVDVMDQLQLSFANSGAAAVANERAMNSLTAQWQRFKNILSEDLESSVDTTMERLKNGLKSLNDFIEYMGQVREGAQDRIANNYNYGGNTMAWLGDRMVGMDATTLVAPQLTIAGKALDYFTGRNAAAQAASAELETQVSETTDAVDKQTGLISELDKEIARLAVQKDTLRSNDIRSGAEIATLTSRFEGLAIFLKNTGNRYDDLTQAMQRFRLEQNNVANTKLLAQSSALTLETADAQKRGSNAIRDIRGNADFMAKLNADQRWALDHPRSQRGQGILGDAVKQFSDKGGDRGLADKLNEVVQAVGTVATNTAQQNIITSRVADNTAAMTREGKKVTADSSDIQNIVTKLGSATGADQAKLGQEGLAKVTALDRYINGLLANKSVQGANRTFLQNALGDNSSLRQQITAALAPTKAQLEEQKRAEREATKRPLVTQADIDAIVNGGSGLNFADRIKNLGERSRADQVSPKGARGTMQVMATTITDPGYGVRPAANNTIEEIDRVGRDYSNALLKHYGSEVLAAAAYNWGPGNVDKRVKKLGAGNFMSDAPGLPKETRDYVGRVTGGTRINDGVGGYSIEGKSPAQAELKASTIRNALANAGIDATVTIDNATKRIVVSVRKGTRFTKDRTDTNADKFDAKLAQAQVSIDQTQLANDLVDVAKATTDETQKAAINNAMVSLDALNKSIKDAAEKELASQGLGELSPEYQAKMMQVQQTINENVENFNQKVTDAILKSIKKQGEIAQTAFEKATAGAEQSLAVAQGQLTGLDAYSLRNKVPDYVKSLASDRVAQAQENVTRAQYAATPALQAAKEQEIAAAQAALTKPNVNADQINAQLATLNVELEKIKANREALAAQLGAGGLLPQTFSQGLDQAIQAYRQANDVGQTFSQNVLMNMGGALDEVNNGLTTMFTSILDGSQSALQAFGTFAKGIMQWMVQLAAKAVATQVFNLLLNAVGGAVGGKAAASSSGPSMGLDSLALGRYEGGPIYRAAGGEVTNGDVSKDSVDAKLARGEWVMQKSAVDSVGSGFMARLNQHGSKALDSLQSMPKLDMRNHTETNVYVVPPEQQPTMGPNDVRVILNDELMNGDGKRLVQHIASDR